MPSTDAYQTARLAMVASQLRKRGITDERVLAAVERVPRHLFVPAALQYTAYDDNPVPIGEGQTVSQPYIVAYMLQILDIASEHRVLEIGTGTGYQAALLGELARDVYTVERVPSLFERASQILSELDYNNVHVAHGDGTRGLREHAPYDRIVVAAAAPTVPLALFEQLAEGGRMVVPVGSAEVQELMLVRKLNAAPDITQLEGCRFVPLLGEQGFRA
jgi:protein-L-isoaspartate(D-aspartate) O-methyltransferase